MFPLFVYTGKHIVATPCCNLTAEHLVTPSFKPPSPSVRPALRTRGSRAITWTAAPCCPASSGAGRRCRPRSSRRRWPASRPRPRPRPRRRRRCRCRYRYRLWRRDAGRAVERAPERGQWRGRERERDIHRSPSLQCPPPPPIHVSSTRSGFQSKKSKGKW